MRAKDKREIAEKCLIYARKGNFKKASEIRRQAYALDPPGSIGVDWSDKNAIWATDKRYLDYLNAEPFSDLQNTKQYIDSMKSALFVDYLFDFRDSWAIDRHREFCREKMFCPTLDKFRRDMEWEFESEPSDMIYFSTVKRNINSKIYNDSIERHKNATLKKSHIYQNGEYYLGFSVGTPESVIENRRIYLRTWDQYIAMGRSEIDKFPKTFQTFQKHKAANSEKYQEWMRQYSILRNRTAK